MLYKSSIASNDTSTYIEYINKFPNTPTSKFKCIRENVIFSNIPQYTNIISIDAINLIPRFMLFPP